MEVLVIIAVAYTISRVVERSKKRVDEKNKYAPYSSTAKRSVLSGTPLSDENKLTTDEKVVSGGERVLAVLQMLLFWPFALVALALEFFTGTRK